MVRVRVPRYLREDVCGDREEECEWEADEQQHDEGEGGEPEAHERLEDDVPG